MTETTEYTRTAAAVLLPRTRFAAHPSAAAEQELAAAWAQDTLHVRLRETEAGRPRFLLHDGPPFANGDLHLGHAANKFLKDMAVRFRRMAGFAGSLRPGWDCHGLPVEWKVEEALRAEGRAKRDVSVLEFRARCRDWGACKTMGFVPDWVGFGLT